MKKVFIAATLLIGMVTGAMVLSSFCEPKEESFLNDVYTNVPAIVYEGFAISYDDDVNPKLWIVVREFPNACNKYHAIVEHQKEVFVVKENPKYDPELEEGRNSKQYYITFGTNYYFNI